MCEWVQRVGCLRMGDKTRPAEAEQAMSSQQSMHWVDQVLPSGEYHTPSRRRTSLFGRYLLQHWRNCTDVSFHCFPGQEHRKHSK